jgi:hypothetical protein
MSAAPRPVAGGGAGDVFKWICLGVAVVFLSVALWMLNDVRLHVRRSAEVVEDSGRVVHQAGEVVNNDLPEIVQRSRETSKVVSDALPEVVERVERTTEVVAELSEDLKQLKELAGVSHVPRDRSVVAYADSVLKRIESSAGEIGVKKNVGSGLKNVRPAADWVREERREAAFLAVLGKSKKQMLDGIVRTKWGTSWFIQAPGQKPVRLLDWLKENHPETRELLAQ